MAGLAVLYGRPGVWRPFRAVFTILLAVMVLQGLYLDRDLPMNALAAIKMHEMQTRGLQVSRDPAGKRGLALRMAMLAVRPGHATGGRVMLALFGVHHRRFDNEDGMEPLGGRYDGLLPLFTVTQANEMIADLNAKPDAPLLLPAMPTLSCAYTLADERDAMQKVLLPFYTPGFKRNVVAGAPLCAYVEAHYRPENSPLPFMVVWVPKRNLKPLGEECLLKGAVDGGGRLVGGADVAGEQGVGGALGMR